MTLTKFRPVLIRAAALALVPAAAAAGFGTAALAQSSAATGSRSTIPSSVRICTPCWPDRAPASTAIPTGSVSAPVRSDIPWGKGETSWAGTATYSA